jgi:predicted peptidase
MTQKSLAFIGQVQKEVGLKYLLHLPEDYDNSSSKKWPLILFLHGMGERGDDVELVKRHGIARIAETKGGLPFITVSPQCPADSWWLFETDALVLLLDEIIRTYSVDTDRVYLTGLSMGGFGTWYLASLYPERFAAIAPICGGGLRQIGFPERAAALKDVPVWAFHGSDDNVVPVQESQKIVDYLQSIGANVKFTVYPGVKHDSWTETYNNPELYEWFLQYARK